MGASQEGRPALEPSAAAAAAAAAALLDTAGRAGVVHPPCW